MSVRVKVCGIRRPEHALLAVEEGAWALGFIFHQPSPRYISPEDAAAITRRLPADVLKVGVFVDWPLAEIRAAVEEVGLGAVQLHGSEGPEYAAEVEAGEVWKAFRVGPDFDLRTMHRFPLRYRVLLDTYRADLPGGSGETFDWEIARRAGEERPIILAGGLGPENVARALDAVGPEAIDVSSGLEVSPGEKDPRKIRELFAAVRRWERRGNSV